MKALNDYLKELTALHAVSSQEDPVIDYMEQHFSAFREEVTVDTIGNVICHFSSGKPHAKKLMIFAHMDEVGFIVRYIDEQGYLYMERIGGANVNVLPGIQLQVSGDQGMVPGVIGTKAYHFLKPEEKGVFPSLENMYLDIGASSHSEAEQKGVHIGSTITFKTDFLERENGRVTSKALDNRVSCALLLTLAEKLADVEAPLEWDIYLAACVQEEFNIRGVLPAVRRIKPDVSIGLDVTPACDTPELLGYSDVALDKGPALTFFNYHGKGTLAGVLPDTKLMKSLVKTCESHSLPYQREIAAGVITENAFIVFEEYGVATANISIPTRYTHTPVETVSMHDVNLTEKLLFHFATTLTKDQRFGKAREVRGSDPIDRG